MWGAKKKRNIVKYNAGDLVQIRHEIPNRPIMVVEKAAFSHFRIADDGKTEDSKTIQGIDCMWFGPDMSLHRGRFNFKDLEKIKSIRDEGSGRTTN